MSGGPDRLALRHVLALGVLQGPCELLPISSSGHLTLIPWLLRRDDATTADPELRKALEVALHAGTAVALLAVLREDVIDALTSLKTRRVWLILLSFLPPAAVGYALERPIERRLGTPRTIAWGLLIGSAAMVLADEAPQLRTHETAGPRDAIWLGIAQACALMPGVSRNGATLAAARARGFRRADADRLSRHIALPVILGATALKVLRLRGRESSPEATLALLAGAGAACGSTVAAARLLGSRERDRRLLPFALYRAVLATVTLRRLAREGGRAAGSDTSVG